MANNPYNFWSCCTRGLEELDSSEGSPDVSATLNSGDRAYQLGASATTARICKLARDQAAGWANGDFLTIIAVVRVNNTTPSASYVLFANNQSTWDRTNENFAVTLETDGDLTLTVGASGATTIGQISAPLTDGQFHTFRFDIEWQDSATGSIKLTVDDGTPLEDTAADTLHNTVARQFWVSGAGSGDGDVFVDCVAAWLPDAYAPADLPTTIAKTNPYQTGHTTATDLGSALDSGTWDNTGELPIGTTNIVQLTSAKDSGTDTDDGTRTGPTGDADLSGATLLLAKVGIYAKRSNGAGTTHTLYYGDSSETWTSGVGSTALTLDTAYDWFEAIMSDVPTTSEYFRFGIGRSSGGRDFDCAELFGCILYEPAAGGTIVHSLGLTGVGI